MVPDSNSHPSYAGDLTSSSESCNLPCSITLAWTSNSSNTCVFASGNPVPLACSAWGHLGVPIANGINAFELRAGEARLDSASVNGILPAVAGPNSTPTPAPDDSIPVVPVNHLPVGIFESLSANGLAMGTASDPDQNVPLLIQAFGGGAAGAGQYLGATNTVNGTFQIQLPRAWQNQSIYVYAIDSNDSTKSTLLTGSPRQFTAPNILPTGWFDGINEQGIVSGWSYDPDTSDQSNQVHVYAGGPAGIGRLIGITSANLPRADVNAVFAITGQHGFNFQLPLHWRRGQSIYAYAIDSEGGTNPLISNSGQGFYENHVFQVGGSGRDLMEITRRNTGSGNVEVHTLTESSGFSQYSVHVATPQPCSESSKFDYLSGGGEMNGDLVQVMRRATGSGNLEVHILSRASNYQTYTTHAAIPISNTDGENFTFALAGRDLVGIKRRRTDSGKVEIHVLSAASNYSQFINHAALPWSVADEDRFDFDMKGRDLMAILKFGTTEHRIEVHGLTASSNYQNGSFDLATAFSWIDREKMEFAMAGSDLVGIKRLETGSGRIEAHALTWSSAYETFLYHLATNIPQD